MRPLCLSSLLPLWLLAGPAFGQTPEASPAAEAAPAALSRSANPGGADDPAEVARNSGLEAAPDAGASVLSEVALSAADAGSVLTNPDDEVSGRIGASARVSYQFTGAFPVDEKGTSSANGRMGTAPFETRLRVNPEVHFKGFGFVAEADTATGAVFGLPPEGTFAERTPHPAFSALDLRQLFVEYKWKTGVFRVGQQLSQWGLGILANGGNKDAEAGEFGQQHFGSLTYRALVAGRPLYSMGGAFRAIEPIVAADLVVRDGTAEFAKGDRAFQAVVALRFAVDADHYLGIYGVYRSQRAVGVVDNARSTDVFVIDLAGKWTFSKTDFRAFNVGFELAGIGGTTTQGRNPEAPVLNVRQFGAAVKTSYRRGRSQLYLDWGFASGDQNPGDDRIENFRFDRDYKVGLILFDEVLGYQSARSAYRAADPTLLGQAPEGVALAPTGGAVTSAWFLYPRMRFGIFEWLDVYGGPLFAFSTAKLTDPFNSRLGGGTSINYLGGSPGGYLGTELDLGLQARWHPIQMVIVTGTFETGLLLPGDAFTMAGGGVMGPIGMARLRLAVSL